MSGRPSEALPSGSMGPMTTRLGQQYPEIAAGLRELAFDEQSEVVQRLARLAAERSHLSLPSDDSTLVDWSAALDSRGWTRDAEGEWRQSEGDFARARAAEAVRLAIDASTATNVEDSLYESIAVLGLDPVRDALGLGPG